MTVFSTFTLIRQLEMEIHVQAPAKINLHLEVLGRRQDGYHELLSIFQLTTLGDELTFRSLKDGPDIDLEGSFDCPPGQNLIVRAAEALRRSTGRGGGVRIEVEKRIPAGGGLGGGSSDAAAALWALDRLWGTRLGTARLLELAGDLGSDVPFFLTMLAEREAAALVQGRGEIVRPLEARTDFSLVLAFPGFSVPTPLAYGWLSAGRSRRGGTSATAADQGGEELREMYLRSPVAGWRLRNDFEEPVESRHPEAAEIRSVLLHAGALQARMSGSGSAIFGLFPQRSAAEEAAAGLSVPGCRFVAADPLAKPAELRLN